MTDHTSLTGHGRPPQMSVPVLDAMQAALHGVSQQTIEAVVSEVPGYRDSLDAQARTTLAQAVEMALRGFLALTAEEQDPSAPLAPALDGAFVLGRGEAARGRSMDALLAAYRVGARVAWRGLAGTAAQAGLSADDVVLFAELVFAYIDALSAASVAGHAEELAAADRARQRNLERLGHVLVTGASDEALNSAAQRAGWAPPTALAAVILPDACVDEVRARIEPRTLQPVDDIPGLESGEAVLLVPDPGARFLAGLERGLRGERAVVGPGLPWSQARHSFARALRAWRLEAVSPVPAPGSGSTTGRTAPPATSGGDQAPASRIVHTEDVLAELVLAADPSSLADLRARALAPLEGLRPAQAERLGETLRSWLLHRGRRDEVAADLFVHPQTVRYRMTQVRELFGDRLDDPREVLNLTIALGTRRP